MSRDYKHTKHQRETRGGGRFGTTAPSSDKTPASKPWLWLIAGIILGGGAMLAFGPSSSEPAPTEPAAMTELPASETENQPAAASESTPLNETVANCLPSTETSAIEPATPEYSFYRLLPEMEIPVLENRYSEPDSNPTTPPKPIEPETPIEKPGNYVLQVASLRQENVANDFVARLTGMGMPARIQKITIDDTTAWHRVRIGPITDLTELNRIREQLNVAGYSPLLLRIKPEL